MKYTIILLIASFVVTGAMAQEYKTDVSIRNQVINGSVPGAQYRDAKNSRPSSVAAKQESVGSQIKNNTEPGKQYKKSAGTSSGKGKTVSAAPAAQSLTSDQKMEKIQPAKAPALPQNLTQ